MHKNTTNAGLTNPAVSAETVIYTTPVVAIGPVGPPANPIDISGTAFITPGTGATGITLRCRAGGLTGPMVSQALAFPAVAGTPAALSYGFTDVSTFLEQVGGGQYVITATQTGAPSAGGTSNNLDIKVMT